MRSQSNVFPPATGEEVGLSGPVNLSMSGSKKHVREAERQVTSLGSTRFDPDCDICTFIDGDIQGLHFIFESSYSLKYLAIYKRLAQGLGQTQSPTFPTMHTVFWETPTCVILPMCPFETGCSLL